MRGGDTSALRAYNERLIIGAIRQRGPLSKAELARATGLSAQAAAMIANALVADGLLAKQPKVRGQVGQPYTPMALAPGGAYALGVKIGRRSTEAIVVDFVGETVAAAEAHYREPAPSVAMPRARSCAAQALEAAGVADHGRIVGVGIAMPGDLPAWSTELGLRPGVLDGWNDIDVAAEFGQATGLMATLHNDATAACAAEMALGAPIIGSALYLYLGTFVGGGLILDGRLYRGRRGNAAAIGSMPMATVDAIGQPHQLIHEASVIGLQRRLLEAGIDPTIVIDQPAPNSLADAVVGAWIDDAAPALARAVLATASVVDLETVIVDGLLTRDRIAAVAGALTHALERFNTKGLQPFEVRPGSVGRPARVLGAALLPLHERFSPDADVLIAGPRERASAG